MNIMNFLIVVFSSLALAACSIEATSDSDSDGSDGISLSFTCTIATSCADNSVDGADAYAAVVNAGDTCSDVDGTNFEGFGSVTPVSCTGGTCTASGSIDNFRDTETDAVVTIDNGTYSVFAFIDSNGDGDPDSGEPATCTDDLTWDGNGLSLSITGDQS